MKFLETLARDLVLDAEQGSRILVLVPNKRAGIFLKRSVQSLVTKPVFAPDIVSSEAFVSEITGFSPADHVALVILLYELYVEELKILDSPQYEAVADEDGIFGTKVPDLGDFFGIGSVLLRDFDEIDRYCIDSDALFAEMGQVGKDSALSEKFRTLWGSAGNLYKRFKEAALARGLVYTGLIYRTAVESLADRELPYDKVYWAGLYACTESEKRLFAILEDKFHDAFKVYLDLDAYYCLDENQEAGEIYRKFWKPNYSSRIPAEFAHKEITIETVPVQGGTGMAKFAGTVLEALPHAEGDEEIPSVAVILPDASLLFPVLNSIPERFKHINVTMGLPFRSTRLYSFCMLLFVIQETVSGEDGGRVFIDDFSELINHPYFGALCADGVREKLRLEYESRVRENNAYLPASLLSAVQPVADFVSAADARSAMRALVALGGEITAKYLDSASASELRVVYEGWQAFAMLGEKLETFASLRVPQLKKIIDTVFSSQGIAFTGEPLKGLQVMGMLETQCLAFDTVIFISANEGLLPFQSSGSSLIPDSVRRITGLPSSAASDAVTAYHFYRLVSHARQVYLVYSENSELQGKDEPSRFIQQLDLEYREINHQCKYGKQPFRYPVIRLETKAIAVPNTDEIRARLCEKPLSPSALSLYSACPLRFYYAHALGLKEADTVSEDPDAALVGNIFHSALESLFGKASYGPETLYKELEPLVDEAADQAIRKHLPHTRFTGNHYMLRRASRSLIRRFVGQLQNELLRKNGESYAVLEKEYALDTSLKLRGSRALKFKGKIDHLGSIGACSCIIDFKTGGTGSLTLTRNPDDTYDFEVLRDYKRKELLQLLCYTLLLREEKGRNASSFSAEAWLYCFRDRDPFKKLVVKTGRSGSSLITEDLVDDFSEWLSGYCADIMETESFAQTADLKHCKFCPYTAVCMR